MLRTYLHISQHYHINANISHTIKLTILKPALNITPYNIFKAPMVGCIVHLLVLCYVESVLKAERKDFLSKVNAKAIVEEVKAEGIIPESVESEIISSKSRSEQNRILFTHVLDEAPLDRVRKLCDIMVAAEGYGKMIAFGRRLLDRLEKVGFY